MVAGLPSMALWVIAFFFVYKVVVIGSIYGLLRFFIAKMHDWLTRPRKPPVPQIEMKEIRPLIDGMCISMEPIAEDLITELKRIRGKNVGIHSQYIHRQSLDWLREAINEKEQ